MTDDLNARVTVEFVIPKICKESEYSKAEFEKAVKERIAFQGTICHAAIPRTRLVSIKPEYEEQFSGEELL